MDDKSYFPFSHTEVPGNTGFCSTVDKANISPDMINKVKLITNPQWAELVHSMMAGVNIQSWICITVLDKYSQLHLIHHMHWLICCKGCYHLATTV